MQLLGARVEEKVVNYSYYCLFVLTTNLEDLGEINVFNFNVYDYNFDSLCYGVFKITKTK